MLFQIIKGLRLRMYWGQFMQCATMTVSWQAIPARKISALVVVWFCDFLLAAHILILRWCAFHNSSYFIEGSPFVRIPLDAWEHAVRVSGTSFFGCAAGFLTIADPMPLYHVYFRADPFVAVWAFFLMAVPGVFHVQGAVFGAGRIAVDVIADFFKGAFIPWVIRIRALEKWNSSLRKP